MNDRQLKYILEIAREGNLTSAAKRLYISQPSLSNLLEQVETKLGARLFERTAGGMVLTPAGECYIATAQQILGSISDLEQKITEIRNGQRGTLSIGCSNRMSAIIFPTVIPALRERYPLYKLTLREDAMEVLAELLAAGDLDIALLYSNYHIHHVKAVPLHREEVCIIAPGSASLVHVQPQREGPDVLTDLSELNKKPFVLHKKGRMLRKIADDIFRENRISPQIILETDSWQTCLAMVENDRAFSLLPISLRDFPQYTGGKRENVRFWPLVPEKKYYRQLSVCYREGLEGSGILQDFLDICRTVEIHVT